METGWDQPQVPLHLHPMGFIEAFCDLGADQTALLRDTGISPVLFDMRDVRISHGQFERLLLNGIELCDRPALGIWAGLRFDWSYWGTVGYVVHCSPSLKHAGEAFRRYLVLSQPGFALQTANSNAYLDADNRVVEPIDYMTGSDTERVLRTFIRDWRLAITLRVWDSCGNKAVQDPGVHVRLDIPRPASTEPYEALPCQSLRFGCDDSSISAHRDFVFRRFRLLRRRAFEQLLQDCERQLARSPQGVSFTERVRWHLRAHFRPGLKLEVVARQLRVTPRGLSRRLATDGTSFRRLMHSVRMEIVRHQLRHSRLRVEEVAAMAGFSCASSLRRAVKRWSGTTVGELRELPQ